MRIVACALLLGCLPASALAADESNDRFLDYVVSSGKVNPDLCWESPPDALYRLALDDKGWDKTGFFQSLAGMDVFFQAYAKQLRPLVDRKCPNAREFREELNSVFQCLNAFDACVKHGGGTGQGHWEKQIPAHVEWLLCRGFKTDFDCESQGYGHDDLQAVAEVIVRGKHLVKGPEDAKENKDALRGLFQESMKHLRLAEEHMSDKEKRYYRDAVMRQLARSL